MANRYTTLSSIIDTKSAYDINKVTFFTITDDSDLIVTDTSLFTLYQRYINAYVNEYSVTKEQREYYEHRPYLLSKHIYGTPELGWLILFLNDQECASKFYLKQTVRIIPTTALSTIYDTIVTKSHDRLAKNWDEYLSKVTS